ncbi:MAG: hypothetical protein HQ549_06855 [Candidatus Omnitrophica bacterium]|nr:hypothetical protein [Candidatus Omnitrophota bacterium]
MSIIEAVKKGFTMSGKLLNVVIIFFILNVVMGLVSLPFASPENVGNPGVAAISFILSLVFFAIFIFLQGGALGLTRDLLKTGACNISSFASYGKKYYVRILGLLLLYVLVAVALVLVLGLAGSGILALANNLITRTIVGAIAGIVAIAAIVILLFPIYAIVADDASVMQAFKKGTKLGKENFWNILGLFLALVVISVVISLVIGFVIGLITVPLPFAVTQIIITIVNGAVQSYIPIVMMLALMGCYLGLSKGQGGSQTGPA